VPFAAAGIFVIKSRPTGQVVSLSIKMGSRRVKSPGEKGGAG